MARSPPHAETEFSTTFTAPAAGTELQFPIVQTCEAGEIAWIDATEDDEHPAPIVAVGPAGAAPSTEAAHGEGEESMEDAVTTTPAAGEDQSADTTDDDDSSSASILIGGIVVVLLLAGGALVLRSRRGA